MEEGVKMAEIGWRSRAAVVVRPVKGVVDRSTEGEEKRERKKWWLNCGSSRIP